MKLKADAPHSAGLKYCSHTRHVSRLLARCVGLRVESGVGSAQLAACSFRSGSELQLASSQLNCCVSIVCAQAMAETDKGSASGAEETVSTSSLAAPSASSSPAMAPVEPIAAEEASASSSQSGSDLLQKIKELQDTQRALKAQKQKCAQEMKNALKRKKRLQGKASQLSDADLVEVLRMRKAKKETVTKAEDPAASEPPLETP